MRKAMDIDMTEVRRRLSYDPATGLFHILPRSADMYSDTPAWSAAQLANSFNNRLAGKVAGATLDRGYVKLHVMGRQILAHRLAFLFMGEPAPEVVDHINGNTSDNRWANLRACDTQRDNTTNRKRNSNNTSGFRGITRKTNTKTAKWEASIKSRGGYFYLGAYTCLGLAIKARKQGEAEHGFLQRWHTL